MDKEKFILELLETIKNKDLAKITFSNIRDKSLELEKVIDKFLLIKKKIIFNLDISIREF
ncbi:MULTISPECIES: hypothetical protein [unclassified Gemella]|uniref:hypothetical protein n=1 Tax=unclassified Gemella TaxID=2624949 RepID=UPI001C056B2A|nr:MULTISPECIES: hypothetical protein [unclassified Gemella]MBU0279034.1 hypothetical protein [Gemella sp. zg-1178]QWQ39105.1 hypothetical protein KMP11_01875 [Gemella sp. zg-570]